MRTRYCTVGQRQGHAGGVIAGTKWEPPVADSVTASRLSSSHGQGMSAAQRGPEDHSGHAEWCSPGLCRLRLAVMWVASS